MVKLFVSLVLLCGLFHSGLPSVLERMGCYCAPGQKPDFDIFPPGFPGKDNGQFPGYDPNNIFGRPGGPPGIHRPVGPHRPGEFPPGIGTFPGGYPNEPGSQLPGDITNEPGRYPSRPWQYPGGVYYPDRPGGTNLPGGRPSGPGTYPGSDIPATYPGGSGSLPSHPGRHPTGPGRNPNDGYYPGSSPGSNPGSSPGSYPGSSPESYPGSNPGSSPGSYPGSNPGSSPESYPGSNPGSSPGLYPGSSPGSYPGSSPGSYPGSSPGSYPGSIPGSNPGSSPGSYPGSHPGSNPGSSPGSYPGSHPGSSPGLYPGSSPGSYPGDPGSMPGYFPGGTNDNPNSTGSYPSGPGNSHHGPEGVPGSYPGGTDNMVYFPGVRLPGEFSNVLYPPRDYLPDIVFRYPMDYIPPFKSGPGFRDVLYPPNEQFPTGAPPYPGGPGFNPDRPGMSNIQVWIPGLPPGGTGGDTGNSWKPPPGGNHGNGILQYPDREVDDWTTSTHLPGLPGDGGGIIELEPPFEPDENGFIVRRPPHSNRVVNIYNSEGGLIERVERPNTGNPIFDVLLDKIKSDKIPGNTHKIPSFKPSDGSLNHYIRSSKDSNRKKRKSNGKRKAFDFASIPETNDQRGIDKCTSY